MSDTQEQRRLRLLQIQAQAGLNNRQLADVLDRNRETVTNMRSGWTHISDHTLALLELAHRFGLLEQMAERTKSPRWMLEEMDA